MLHLIKLPAQEIYVVPFRAASFEVLNKGSMGLAELPDTIQFLLPVLFDYFASGIGIQVIAEEKEIEFEAGGEPRFEMFEKIDLNGIVMETGLADFLLGQLPVMGDDLVALLGLLSVGRVPANAIDGLLHFFLQAEDGIFHGSEV